MRMTRISQTLPLLLGFLVFGCNPETGGPRTTDSQTNWLRACQSDSQCSGLSCLCGVCTYACGGNDACSALPGAACVAANEPGAIARCGGSMPSGPGLCLPRCEDAPCPDGQMCVASVCEPVPETKERITVDTSKRQQAMIGFGASVAYSESEILSHPKYEELIDAAFGELGLDVLRFRNRFANPGDDDLSLSRNLVDAATRSLGGRAPTILLTLWSPPAALKANGDVVCSGNPGTCTLVKTAAGAYDYEGFATHWRESLDAYADVGLVPDYIGIQNNANWVPTAQEPGQACRFLPVEGTTSVTIAGNDVQVSYPGYAEALSATRAALEGLPVIPKILAPETSDFEAVSDFTPDLDFSMVDALAHHLYGVDPAAMDTVALDALGDFGVEFGRPILQTEMQADGYNTAVFIHRTLEVEGGAAYLQSNLTGSTTGLAANPNALIGLRTADFVRQDPFYAMRHYAFFTDPGWLRVASTSTVESVLSTAWIAPDDSKLTLVIVNTGNIQIDVEVDPGAWASSRVVRTVFGADERFAELGALSLEGMITLPARSIVTVALEN
jgi:glucuronoarabinoxylan endo-1,4-beta-xylanase